MSKFHPDDRPWKEPELLALALTLGGSMNQAADLLGCSDSTVERWRAEYGFNKPRPDPRSVPPRIHHDQDGYEIFKVRDGSGVRRVVRHHRLLAVMVYGLNALGGMEVHHVNDIPWDNRPDNIEPIDPNEHSKMSSHKYHGGAS